MFTINRTFLGSGLNLRLFFIYFVCIQYFNVRTNSVIEVLLFRYHGCILILGRKKTKHKII